MVAKQFADSTFINRLTNFRSKTEINKIEWPNLLVQCSTSNFQKNVYETSFSIIANHRGEVHCKIDGKSFKVCSSTFIITNPFQKLEYSIDGNEIIETSNIHFNYNFIQSLYSYYTDPDDLLLENFDLEERQKFPIFYSELHYKNQEITRLIKELSNCTEGYLFEEILSKIGLNLLSVRIDCRNKMVAIKSRRRATKLELYKRISLAKDIIYCNYAQPLTIGELSKNISISKFHFTRLFNDVYGLSPYQFLKAVRLQKAKELLLQNYSIAEVAYKVGFKETNSFINAFKVQTKIYPSQFRHSISKFE